MNPRLVDAKTNVKKNTPENQTNLRGESHFILGVAKPALSYDISQHHCYDSYYDTVLKHDRFHKEKPS